MNKKLCLLTIAALITTPACAQVSEKQTNVMKQLIEGYAKMTKAEADKKKSAAESFSADNGRQIYLASRNWEGEEQPACATCHTDDPKKVGKHIISKKPINPLAPAANPERFTDIAKVEKNFSKHCNELYNRDCTAQEKGHFLTYLLSVK